MDWVKALTLWGEAFWVIVERFSWGFKLLLCSFSVLSLCLTLIHKHQWFSCCWGRGLKGPVLQQWESGPKYSGRGRRGWVNVEGCMEILGSQGALYWVCQFSLTVQRRSYSLRHFISQDLNMESFFNHDHLLLQDVSVFYNRENTAILTVSLDLRTVEHIWVKCHCSLCALSAP